MSAEKPKNLSEYDGPDRILSSHEMQLLIQEQKSGFVKVKSRIPSLDRLVEGFRDGELITISGPTKNGKTLLAQTLTANFCRQQEFPLWFSLCVAARHFLDHFPALPLFYLPAKLKPHVFAWLDE